MSMTLKTTKNLFFGLSVVFKITTRRSTIDVRKKSDLSRKNRTTGPPGHVRKISDQPQPGYLLTVVPGININTSIGTCQQPVTSAWTLSLPNLSPIGTLYQRRASQRILSPHSSHACAAPHSAALRYPPIGAILLRGLPIIEPEPEPEPT